MTTILTPPPPARPPDAGPGCPRRRWRMAAKVAAGVLAGLLTVTGATAWWAADRYLIDHVQIADVDAFEAEARASGDGATIDATPTDATSILGTSTDTIPTDAVPTDGTAVVTDTTYQSDTASIAISTVVTGSGTDRVTYYVADVVLNDATALRGGFANNQFGTNIVEDTSDIAADNEAVLAINGDYYGFRDSGIVIRNGVLFRDEGARTGLAIYTDGTMAIYDETATSGEELLADGVWNTLSFGPALIDEGEIVAGIEDVEVDTNIGNHSIQGDQPRTAIGMIDANHFVFVVVDGRATGYSRGVTMTELAGIMQDLGATVAYNLDGGGSATMVFNGELVNNPLGKGAERETSDILYIA